MSKTVGGFGTPLRFLTLHPFSLWSLALVLGPLWLAGEGADSDPHPQADTRCEDRLGADPGTHESAEGCFAHMSSHLSTK